MSKIAQVAAIDGLPRTTLLRWLMQSVVAALLMMFALALASPATAGSEAAGHEADKADIRRGYVDSIFGQLHFYEAAPQYTENAHTPLVLLHQTARSGLEFDRITRAMGTDRTVLAFDTPGYGLSDAPPEAPDVEILAQALAVGLENLGYGAEGKGQVDILGFHTGSFIAAELAIERPDLVRRVVFTGVPYFPEERRQTFREGVLLDPDLEAMTERLERVWSYGVLNRQDWTTQERAIELFLRDIQSLRNPHYGFYAVWNYPVEERLPRIAQPVYFLTPTSSLLEESKNARRDLLPGADYEEFPEELEGLFEGYPEEFAAYLRGWLDKDVAQ